MRLQSQTRWHPRRMSKETAHSDPFGVIAETARRAQFTPSPLTDSGDLDGPAGPAPIDLTEESEAGRPAAEAVPMRREWREVVAVAGSVEALPAISVPLASAAGAKLSEPIRARTPLPPTDCADVTGWAVAGFGPWTLAAEPTDPRHPLPDGSACTITAGDVLPPGCTAVHSEHTGIEEATSAGRWVLAARDGQASPTPGQVAMGVGIRPRESVASQDQILLQAGGVVTPAVVALAAAAGVDDLLVVPPATATALVPRSGLTRRGPVRAGRMRDSVADLLLAWLEQSPARHLPANGVPEDPRDLADLIEATSSDIIVLASGMATGLSPLVRHTLHLLDSEPLVTGVDVRPGGAAELHALADQRYLLALPGRPGPAAAALTLLFDPLAAALAGQRPDQMHVEALLASAPDWLRAGAGSAVELVPVIIEPGDLALRAHPLGWLGPDGAQGLAAADGLAVIGTDRPCESGALVQVLPLPGVLLG